MHSGRIRAPSGAGDCDTVRVRTSDFAGGKRQQRPHAFAGAEHRVTHRAMQALRGDISRRKHSLQLGFDALLAAACPMSEIRCL